ncbi:MAG: acetyltransferase [Cyanobacteria bacterium J06659_2]
MTPKSILLVGAGGHAQACIDVLEQAGRFTILGLVGRPEEVGSQVLGYPVLGTDDDLTDLHAEASYALVTLGQIKTPVPRIRLFNQLQQLGFQLPVVISPQAYVSRHAQVNIGTIVMHGAYVNAGAVVGRNCILNTKSLVEHNAVIGDHCHVSTAATVNGGVKVGDGVFLGSNSSLREMICIAPGAIVGMGQTVRQDLAADSPVVGELGAGR